LRELKGDFLSKPSVRWEKCILENKSAQ
jgi:hypothetical protein